MVEPAPAKSGRFRGGSPEPPPAPSVHAVRGTVELTKVNANTFVRLALAFGSLGGELCRAGFHAALHQSLQADGDRTAERPADRTIRRDRIRDSDMAKTTGRHSLPLRTQIEQTVDVLSQACRIHRFDKRSCFFAAHYYASTARMEFVAICPAVAKLGDSRFGSERRSERRDGSDPNLTPRRRDSRPHSNSHKRGLPLVGQTDPLASPVAMDSPIQGPIAGIWRLC